ncbi:MAG: hypothetical protein ACLQQ4_18270 [Bacteroidia bacterium]
MLNTIREIRGYKLYKWKYLKRVWEDSFNRIPPAPSFEKSLESTFQWIDASFKATGDGGSSAYYQFGKGWATSYPETTGYLIPTLYDYSAYTKDAYWSGLAKKTADWLLSIQSVEGGWQGLQIGVPCELRIFNTGMILDGMMAAYRNEKNEAYLISACKGVEWIVSKVGENGLFISNNPVKTGWSADLLVLSYVSMVLQYMPEKEQQHYKPILLRSIDAHIKLQHENGCMGSSNFADSFPGTSLLHITGYALDGLLVLFEIFNDKKYYNAAIRIAENLLKLHKAIGQIPAYLNSDWSVYYDLGGKKASLCLTGLSQVAICFHKISRISDNPEYAGAADKIIKIVAALGNHQSKYSGLNYGIPGSFPISGSYQKFKILNWAAKFHAESILTSMNKSSSRKRQS